VARLDRALLDRSLTRRLKQRPKIAMAASAQFFRSTIEELGYKAFLASTQTGCGANEDNVSSSDFVVTP
jgi:hypothetical protein